MPPKKPVQPTFVPLVPAVGQKEFLSPDRQLVFVNWFGTLSDVEKAAVIGALNMIASAPILDTGYKKFFHWYRAWRSDATAVQLKF